jgi:hypothetical protein
LTASRELRHFVLALWLGDATAASADLVAPAWGDAQDDEGRRSERHLRALDRYLARLADGLDRTGHGR